MKECECGHPRKAHQSFSGSMGAHPCQATVYEYAPHREGEPYQIGSITEIAFSHPCQCFKFTEAKSNDVQIVISRQAAERFAKDSLSYNIPEYNQLGRRCKEALNATE